MRNLNLDIIRLFAAFMVLTVHIGQYFPALNPYTAIGAKGVQLFFILSGYLVMYSVDSSKTLREFYKKRIIHIVPVYYIVLCGMYFCDIFQYGVLGHVSAQQMFGADGVCGIRYLRYFTFLHMFIPSDNWNLWNNRNALWSISAFVLFYAIAPLLHKVFNDFVKTLIILGVLLFTNEPVKVWIVDILKDYPMESQVIFFAEMNPVSVLYCFLFGVTLFWAVKKKKEGIYGVFVLGTLIFTQFRWFAYEGILTLGVLIMVKSESIVTNDKVKTAIKKLSQGSFALYLCHFKILQLIDNIWKTVIGLDYQIIKLLLMLVISIGGSYLFWLVIEEPIERRLINETIPPK